MAGTYEPRRTPPVPRTLIDVPSPSPRRSPQRPTGTQRPQPPVRKYSPKAPWVYTARRWGAGLLLVFFIVGFIRACVPSEHDREMKAWKEQASLYSQPAAGGIEQDVAVGMPVEMVIPGVDTRAKFEDGNCRFKDGAIDPATLDKACVYTADDKPYSLPGTSAEDIVVIAGHAAAGVPAVFDKLYDAPAEKHTVTPGDTMYLRTATSGDRWLMYQATDLHSPDKEGLPQSAEIWGNVPMPGRLLTITCVQPANPFQDSVRNAVIGWQLQGVVGADEVR